MRYLGRPVCIGLVLCLATGWLSACGDSRTVTPPPPPPPRPEPPSPPPPEPKAFPADLAFERLEIVSKPRRGKPFRLRAVVRNRGPNAAKVAELQVRATITTNHWQNATDMSDLGIASGTVRDLAPGQTQTLDLTANPINRSGFGRAYGSVKLLLEEDPNPGNDRIKDVQFVIQ